MFAKRALALVAVAAMATSSAFAQEAGIRELQKTTNQHVNTGPTDPYWNGPKVVKTANDVKALYERWANALTSGWKAPNSYQSPSTAAILAQYAPDGAVSFKLHSGSGLATGSQLLATLENDPLTTNALRQAYFSGFLTKSPQPTPGSMLYRVLSKDVVTAAGTWSFTFQNPSASANARVTFVWKRYPKVTINNVTYKNKWLIVEMHSSLLPETP